MKKLLKKASVFTVIALMFSLPGCSSAPSNNPEISDTISTPPPENSDNLTNTSTKHVTELEFANDEEFWEYAEKIYTITPFDDIHSGNKKREVVLVDALFLESHQENSTSNEYLIAFHMEDGTYKCYKETLKPSFNNLITDFSILDSLKQGDTIRICAMIPNGNYVDFDSMYGLKITGTDTDAVKIALNISENPLMNLTLQTDFVISGSGDKVLGEYAYYRMDKEKIKQITSEQYKEFVDSKIKESGYNYCSIIFTDGTGIQWPGSDPESATYGKMDLEGCVIEPEGYIKTRDGECTYIPSTNN